MDLLLDIIAWGVVFLMAEFVLMVIVLCTAPSGPSGGDTTIGVWAFMNVILAAVLLLIWAVGRVS